MTDKIIRVGMSIVVLNPQGLILLGKRLSKHRYGTWGQVGGYLEFGESFEEGAKRECLEETGLELMDVKFLSAFNVIFPEENHHSITLYMIGRVTDEEPRVMEPEKCAEWRWFNWFDQVPQPHFVDYASQIDRVVVKAYFAS